MIGADIREAAPAPGEHADMMLHNKEVVAEELALRHPRLVCGKRFALRLRHGLSARSCTRAMHMHINTCTDIPTGAPTQVKMRTQARMRAHTHAHARTRTHTHPPTHARARAHTHTHIHTHARTHAHTHTHTLSPSLSLSLSLARWLSLFRSLALSLSFCHLAM